ncbi:MAG: DUF1028 domain-containing protein [Chloroflexi bacterium]|nr:DUF1028 domain-containing protein [Chloroflexota bacterium]
MTFTILGRDPDTGELGIAIATYSLAVGATCPKIAAGVGVVTSQASADPSIGTELIELLTRGVEPADAMKQAIANASHSEFRQVGLLAADGRIQVHTGVNTRNFSGHIAGENCLAIGNFLNDENVLIAMVAGFENLDEPVSLANRLLGALYSGKTAGGQRGSDGSHLAERSAYLLTVAPDEEFPIDVRVDFSDDAIQDLAKAFGAYRPMHDYYKARAHDPTNLTSQDEWLKRINKG